MCSVCFSLTCHSSSDMKGMKGCTSRSNRSYTYTSTARVLAAAAAAAGSTAALLPLLPSAAAAAAASPWPAAAASSSPLTLLLLLLLPAYRRAFEASTYLHVQTQTHQSQQYQMLLSVHFWEARFDTYPDNLYLCFIQSHND